MADNTDKDEGLVPEAAVADQNDQSQFDDAFDSNEAATDTKAPVATPVKDIAVPVVEEEPEPLDEDITDKGETEKKDPDPVKPPEQEPVKDIEQQKKDAEIRGEFRQKVLAADPQAFATASSKEFKDWLAAQPKFIQKSANSWDDEAAVEIIKSYRTTVADKKPVASGSVVADANSEPSVDAKQDFKVDLNELKAIKFKGEGDEDITFGDIMSTYGDLGGAIIAVSKHIAEGMVKNSATIAPASNPAIPELKVLQDEVALLKEQNDLMMFRSQVMKAHPDLDAIESDTKFDAWLAGQSGAIQYLWENGKVDDVTNVLNWYKQESVKAVAKGAQTKAKKDNEAIIKVGTGALKGQPSGRKSESRSSVGANDENEFKDAFDS